MTVLTWEFSGVHYVQCCVSVTTTLSRTLSSSQPNLCPMDTHRTLSPGPGQLLRVHRAVAGVRTSFLCGRNDFLLCGRTHFACPSPADGSSRCFPRVGPVDVVSRVRAPAFRSGTLGPVVTLGVVPTLVSWWLHVLHPHQRGPTTRWCPGARQYLSPPIKRVRKDKLKTLLT